MVMHFDVPARPAGVDRGAPTMLDQISDEQSQELRSFTRAFAPVCGFPANGSSRSVRVRRRGSRRAIGEEPRAVARPGTHERLGIAKAGDEQARAKALVLAGQTRLK